MSDAVIDNYCNGIALTNQEVLNELEIIKTFKSNEVMLNTSDKDVIREYAALDAACKKFESEIENENCTIAEYDDAINVLSTFINQNSNNKNIQSFKVALEALKQVKELNVKINNHNMIYNEEGN